MTQEEKNPSDPASTVVADTSGGCGDQASSEDEPAEELLDNAIVPPVREEVPTDTSGDAALTERDTAPLASAPTSAPIETPQLAESLRNLSLAIESVQQRVGVLQQAFDSKLRYDETKNRQFDALHEELRSYQEDFYFKILRPLMMDLITDVYDDLSSLSRSMSSDEGASDTGSQVQRNLAGFVETIEHILDRYGVSAFCEEGDGFSPRRQRAIKFVETGIPDQHRLVAERLRKGFAYGDKILRPEHVSLYRLTIPTKHSDSEES